MERFSCSEEDAANRLRTMIQNLAEEPQGQPIPPQRGLSPIPLADSPPPQNTPLEEEPQTLTKEDKFPDFDLNASISDRIPHNLSQYATGKIENMEYVELWYFTTEGCKEASKATPTAADDTFGILSTSTGLALQSIRATKASRNAIADEQLNWEQIMTTRHTLITTASHVKWPKKHVYALAEFYINLESRKANGDNPRALILYHAIVRRRWHEAMKRRAPAFNLSIINDELYKRCEDQIRDRDQEELAKKASNVAHLPQCNRHLTTSPPPFPHAHLRILPFIFCNATPRNATQRNATQHLPPPPLFATTRLTSRNALHPHGPSFRLSPPVRVAILTQRETIEVQGGHRDRGRMRRRERDMGRTRSSRSRSPKDRSPNPRFRRNDSEHSTHPLSACPICLSRKAHQIRKCQETTLWDGRNKARCSRTEDGRIVDGRGRTLCSNWNQKIGCKDKSTRHLHKCSGCGDTSHGAQQCSLAEKTQPTNPTQS